MSEIKDVNHYIRKNPLNLDNFTLGNLVTTMSAGNYVTQNLGIGPSPRCSR